MSTLLMGCILMGVAGGLAVLWKRRIEELFAFAIIAASVALYGFALGGALEVGYAAVKAVGLACFLLVCIYALLRKESRTFLFTPGAVVFCAFLLMVWWGHRGQLFTAWDDFTHWGLAVKTTFQEGRLPQLLERHTLAFPDYPPLTTLFSCFWIYLAGAFNEGDALRASNLFLLSCFLPLMKNVDWKEWKNLFPVALICLLLPMVFKNGVYEDIYVDGLLGGLMAYALITWFTCEENGRTWAVIGAAMLALPLVKSTGVAVGALTLAVVAFDMLFGRERRSLRRVLGLLASGVCLLASRFSWKAFLAARGVAGSWSSGELTLSNLVRWLSGGGPLYRQRVAENFFLYLAAPENGGWGTRGCYLLWMLAMLLLARWLGRARPGEDAKECARFGHGLAAMVACSVVYTLSLLVSYEFLFDPNEAVGLLSFDRYMSTCMTAMIALGAGLVLAVPRRLNGRANAALAVLTCLMVTANLQGVMNLTFSAPGKIRASIELRTQVEPSQQMLDELGPKDKVAFVGQETTGIPYYMARYVVSPLKMGFVGSWSFYATQEEADKHRDLGDAQCVPPEQWKKGLLSGGYTHVYLYSVNDSFVQDYGFLFSDAAEITDRALYRIDGGGEDMRLVRIV